MIGIARGYLAEVRAELRTSTCPSSARSKRNSAIIQQRAEAGADQSTSFKDAAQWQAEHHCSAGPR